MCYTWVHDKTRVKNIRIKKGKGKDIMVWSRKRHYFFFFFGEEKKTLIECEYNFFFLIVWSDQALILIYFYEDMI